MARHATVPDAIEGFKSESDLAAALRRQTYLRWGLGALGVVVLINLRGGWLARRRRVERLDPDTK